MKPAQNLTNELLEQFKKPFSLHNPDAIIFPVALCGSLVFASMVITSLFGIGVNLGHLLGIYDLPNLSFIDAFSHLLLNLGLFIPVILIELLMLYLTRMSFKSFKTLFQKHFVKQDSEVIAECCKPKKDYYIVIENKKYKTSEENSPN